MDADRFDDVVRSLSAAPSRRTVLGLTLGGALGSLLSLADVAARKRKGKKKNKKRKKKVTPPCTPACEGKECGPDGCDGSCGACSGGASCQDGSCSTTCVPQCAGKTCGDDGCGNSCGTCGGGQTCSSGNCLCPSGQDFCGGACLASCPSVRPRNPVTCECCRPTGVIERVCDTIHDVCCSGLECGSNGGEGTICPGRGLGAPCSFDDQCDSGFCNQNLVCA